MSATHRNKPAGAQPQRRSKWSAIRTWIAATCGLLACLEAAAPAQAAPRPNIVVVMTDDTDSAALAYMPSTLQLVAAQGVRFDRYYVGVSLCDPSRASFLTGRHVHNTGIYHNGRPGGGYRGFTESGLDASTVAVWLKNAGYRTGLIGKYLNGYPSPNPSTTVPPGWTSWFGRLYPAPSNGNVQYNYDMNDNGVIRHYGTATADYATDVYAGKAADFIRGSVAAGKPFFLYLSVHAPHEPTTVAYRHRSLYPTLGVPRTPSFAEADPSDKPNFIRWRKLTAAEIQALDVDYRTRVKSLQAVDDAVRTVHDTLQAVGALANTYIIFSSDNGYHLGQHNLKDHPINKRLAYEEDIRVPLLVRGPNVRKNAVDGSTMIVNVDFAPTIAELAGVTVPGEVDGRSFAAFLRPVGTVTLPPLRQSFPLTLRKADNEPEPLPNPDFRGVRTTRYTWVEWADGQRELYDNPTDPYQLNNLARTLTPATATLRAQLARQTADLATCRGATCRTLENRALSAVPVP